MGVYDLVRHMAQITARRAGPVQPGHRDPGHHARTNRKIETAGTGVGKHTGQC